MTQTYRNNRKGFYTDLCVDSTPIGAIVPTLKSEKNSFDHNFIKSVASSYPALEEIAGNAYSTGDDPAYTHEGYLYCDGTEYNIIDYPGLYEVVGNDYGGLSNPGTLITSGGSGYTTAPAIAFSSPPLVTGNVTATGSTIITSGVVTGISLSNGGSGYTSVPTITIGVQWTTGIVYSSGDQVFNANKVYTATNAGTSGAIAPTHTTGSVSDGAVTWAYAGTQATATVVRIDSLGSVTGITKSNVLSWLGDQNLGTFKVPDMIARKVVGNGPVFGSNSPNVGNSSLGVGNVGGKWYFDQSLQDDYFSLGNIVTTNYDNVTDTVSSDIIGSHTVTITMDDQKLSGPPQHSHAVYSSRPVDDTVIAEASGDRYLVQYSATTKKVDSWEPTNAGQVLRHKHGLLRSPNTDIAVATYDIWDYRGGAGDAGSIQNPRNAADTADTPLADQKYLASGGTGAGTWQPQISVLDPTFQSTRTGFGDDIIGGRKTVQNPGNPIYDWSYDTTWTNEGTYSVSFTSLGTVDAYKFTVQGGGGSGGAGTQVGNAGTPSELKFDTGDKFWIRAGGGGGGGAAVGGGTGPGPKGAGGTNTDLAANSINPGGTNQTGSDGVAGTGQKLFKFTNPSDPDTGGLGGSSLSGTEGSGSKGENVLVGGQDGTTTFPMTSSGTFNFGGITNPTAVSFILKGGKGGEGLLQHSQVPGNGAQVNLVFDLTANTDFMQQNWIVKLGGGAGSSAIASGCGGSGHHAAGCGDGHTGNGGSGGQGQRQNSGQAYAMGGGGGAATVLFRNSVPVAGAGGGGGEGSSGYDNGAGTSGQAPPTGGGSVGVIEIDSGETGGTAGCIGGGGGGGGGGVNEPGGATSAGGDGGPADHGGGKGGQEGVSAWISSYFSTGSVSNHTDLDGSASASVTYNDDYWTAGPGGGGAGGFWSGEGGWSGVGSPSGATITVGKGGDGVSMSGSTSGSSVNGGAAKVRLQIGVITGYSGGNEVISTGQWVISGSKDDDEWDITMDNSGSGSGSAGTFKLPASSTQTPTVLFRGGGGSGATASVTVQNEKVTGVTVTNGGSNYTEEPLVYILHGPGGGAFCSATIDTSSGTVTSVSSPTASYEYTGQKYLKFGGALGAAAGNRFAILKAVDTTDVEFFSVKAARGNGMNGGDASEEILQVKYQLSGQSNWNQLGVIIDPSQQHTDAFLGSIPAVDTGTTSGNYDGDSGATKWHTYTISVPTPAQAPDTKFMLEQPMPPPAGNNDTGEDKDHFGIVECIYWRKKTTQLVFVADSGAISKPAIDSLNYTLTGEPTGTYTSGISAAEATVTLKTTTKIEPVASINPDKDIPLIEDYRTCKYLIKAF